MTDLLTLHKYFLSQHLRRGGVAVDFTMGNGHDTQYLCNAVYGGEAAPGKVYAFDIQQAAVDSTARLLRESGTPENYTLICASHDRVAEFVHEPFDAGVFNLGWLPGSDKKVTTRRSSTLPAIEAAVSLLAPGGILLVAVYPGLAAEPARGRGANSATCAAIPRRSSGNGRPPYSSWPSTRSISSCLE